MSSRSADCDDIIISGYVISESYLLGRAIRQVGELGMRKSRALCLLLFAIPRTEMLPPGIRRLASRSTLGSHSSQRSLRAALTEEAGGPGDIGAVNKSVERVRRDVMAGGGRRDWLAEGAGDDCDVGAI